MRVRKQMNTQREATRARAMKLQQALPATDVHPGQETGGGGRAHFTRAVAYQSPAAWQARQLLEEHNSPTDLPSNTFLPPARALPSLQVAPQVAPTQQEGAMAPATDLATLPADLPTVSSPVSDLPSERTVTTQQVAIVAAPEQAPSSSDRLTQAIFELTDRVGRPSPSGPS